MNKPLVSPALGELKLDFGAIQAAELALLQQIAALPEEVQRSADQYRPLLITNYVYELAKTFNDFYHACPVIHSEEPVRSARLALGRCHAPGAIERAVVARHRSTE